MIPEQSFFVRAGELLRAGPWNLAGRTIRALRLIPGLGVTLREMPNGTIINFTAPTVSFDHPWKGKVEGSKGRVNFGKINGVSPKLNGKDLPEDNTAASAPTIDLSKAILDKDGRGYVAAEVTCSEENWAVKEVKIVQVADLDSEDGKPQADGTTLGESSGGAKNLSGRRARVSLYVIRKRDDGNFAVTQDSFFNLKHRVRASDDGLDAVHFFYV